MRKKGLVYLLAGLAVLLAAGSAAYAAGSYYGSVSDPLITKSYLEKVIQPELERSMQQAIQTAMDNFTVDTEGTFKVVKMTRDQLMTCPLGTELILRSGIAAGYASDGRAALSDTTSGLTLYDGSGMEENHLYVVSGLGNGMLSMGETTVLVSGDYSIGAAPAPEGRAES